MPTDQSHEPESDAASEGPTLQWGSSAFEAGPDIGLIARHTVGLIERENPSTRDRLWSLVADDAPVDDILDELSSTGLKALPDFGIAQTEGSRLRVVARGRTAISVELASGDTHEIDASGVRTWIEEVVSDVSAVTIALSPLEGDSDALSSEDFAVLAGSVPARSITRRYDAADVHAEAAADWSAGATGIESSGDGGDIASAADLGLTMVEPESDAGPGGTWLDDDEPASPMAPQPPEPPAVSPPPPIAPPASPQPAGPPAVGDALPQDAPDSVRPVGSDGPPVGATSIIDPDLSAARGPSDGDEGAPAPGDEAGSTADSAPAGPIVHAVLAFSNGERVSVDRSVLVGRNPKVGGADDAGLPHIMKFEGPGQGLSRTHAEVRIEDGEIIVEDLHSTNGTDIEPPGESRRRLRGGEPVAVVHGTLIDFGEELHCIVEPVS